MTQEITQIKVFISCPGDVDPEKQIARDVCDSISKVYGKSRNIQVKPIDWKKEIIPEITGEGAQSVIDSQLEDYDYDIYIGILWSRFGDKMENGHTPTEWEYDWAFNRMRASGKPKIQFYFKTEEFYPRNSYEANQLSDIINFKEERVQPPGYCKEFKKLEDFQREVYEFILNYVENPKIITGDKLPIPIANYEKVSDYITRKAISNKDHGSKEFYLLSDTLVHDTVDLVRKQNRIVLLGNAGTGKTVELKRIAAHFSTDDSPLYPHIIFLNKYVDQSIEQLLPVDWENLPQSQVLIILDGLDEIKSENKGDIIRKIELFSEQYPSATIIVSCRTNFYQSDTEQSAGTLKGFDTYILLDLNYPEIERYAQLKLAARATKFLDEITKNYLEPLLKVPFYLVKLLELFKINNNLPNSKALIFEQLLVSRIHFDENHFRTTIDLKEFRDKIAGTLEHVALGMEALGRNYISDNEFKQLVPELASRKLLNYCTAWKTEDEGTTWQFEHNNIQEYLAAKALSRQPLEIIKDFISFKPEHKKIIPSWTNTLSFILSIADDSALLDWILGNEPEIAIKFEPDKIETANRIRIFKDIFNNYKEKRIWIDRDKFGYDELGQLGQLDDIIDFLLSEIETANHYTTLSNAIKILGTMNLPHTFKSRARDLLIKVALDKFNTETTEGVQKDALMTLSYLKINSKEVVDQIVTELRYSKSDWVRYGLYYFLHNSNYLREYIDVFLEGIRYLRFDISAEKISMSESRLGNERFELKQGLEKTQSPDAIKKIMKYFMENERDLHDVFMGNHDITFIAENASKAYLKDNTLLDDAVNFSLFMLDNHLNNEAGQFIRFFDNTETRFQAFQKVLGKKSHYKETLLADLANQQCLEYIIDQYESGGVVDDDIRHLLQSLRWENKELFLKFYNLLNEKFDNKFTLPPERDYEKERKERSQRDFNLLFNKKEIIDEIKRIFEVEKEKAFTTKELLNLRSKHWPDLYHSDLAAQILRIIAGDEKVTFEKTVEAIDKWDWDWFCVSRIYEKLSNNEEIHITEEQEDWVVNWCDSKLDEVDFRHAITKTGDTNYSIRWDAIYVWYFFRRFSLEYPKHILLDMLSFDHDRCGIEYLAEHLDESEMSSRILDNLEKGIIFDDVLKNHLDYCKQYRIKEGLKFALQEIINPDREKYDEIRRVALETVCELSDSLAELDEILPDITDDFKWNVVDELIKNKSEFAQEFILKLFQTAEEPDRFRAAEYLIKLQDLDALAYYVDWIKKEKNFPRSVYDSSTLPYLQILEAVPLLIKLLEISYQNDFEQADHFERLDSLVLNSITSIALQSNEHYYEIRESIEIFINKFKTEYKNVNWLYSFLDQLEQKYYVNKSKQISIDEVIDKMQKMSI